jgi:hypothetical protein
MNKTIVKDNYIHTFAKNYESSLKINIAETCKIIALTCFNTRVVIFI